MRLLSLGKRTGWLCGRESQSANRSLAKTGGIYRYVSAAPERNWWNRGKMGKNTAYMIKADISSSCVSRAVWPMEKHRRPIMMQHGQDQPHMSLYESQSKRVHPLRVHFFYIYMTLVLFASIFTTWMFFLQQWLFMSLIVIAYTMLMVFLLHSLYMDGRRQECERHGVQKAAGTSFLPAASPITPMPASISKSATLPSYSMQRYASRTPLPEVPLIRVLETINLKEQ